MSAIRVALIGLGRRAWGVYFPILKALKDKLELAAVCDRARQSVDEAAEHLGVPGFCSVRELVPAGVAEAAIICTPIESHHAMSLFLSRSGVHQVCETSMAMTLRQCREMVAAARDAGVTLHVNEQFFREPVIAFTRQIIQAGIIGQVGRITYYHGHTGYHNNSIWQLYGGGKPAAVNAFTHAMPVHAYLDGAGRWQKEEGFRLRLLHFAGGLLGLDMAGNIKSALGRCPRPGYLEIDGTDGAIVAQPYDRPAPWTGKAEVRLVAQEDWERGAYAESFPIERLTMVGHRVNISDRLTHGGEFHKLRCRLPGRTVEYDNPMLEYGLTDGYLSSVAASLMDFHAQVRQHAEPEFGLEQAVASAEMESAFARSVELGGGRVELPFAEETQAERAALAAVRSQYGVDPMDVDAMIDVAFPKNYVPEAGTN